MSWVVVVVVTAQEAAVVGLLVEAKGWAEVGRGWVEVETGWAAARMGWVAAAREVAVEPGDWVGAVVRGAVRGPAREALTRLQTLPPRHWQPASLWAWLCCPSAGSSL